MTKRKDPKWLKEKKTQKKNQECDVKRKHTTYISFKKKIFNLKRKKEKHFSKPSLIKIVSYLVTDHNNDEMIGMSKIK